MKMALKGLMFHKMFLNPIFWVINPIQVNVYIVLFKTLNVYNITQETRFDWKRYLNIYKIAEEMKVMLEFFLNIYHEIFDMQYT